MAGRRAVPIEVSEQPNERLRRIFDPLAALAGLVLSALYVMQADNEGADVRTKSVRNLLPLKGGKL
jgi:hypothetical protein